MDTNRSKSFRRAALELMHLAFELEWEKVSQLFVLPDEEAISFAHQKKALDTIEALAEHLAQQRDKIADSHDEPGYSATIVIGSGDSIVGQFNSFVDQLVKFEGRYDGLTWKVREHGEIQGFFEDLREFCKELSGFFQQRRRYDGVASSSLRIEPRQRGSRLAWGGDA